MWSNIKNEWLKNKNFAISNKIYIFASKLKTTHYAQVLRPESRFDL